MSNGIVGRAEETAFRNTMSWATKASACCLFHEPDAGGSGPYPWTAGKPLPLQLLPNHTVPSRTSASKMALLGLTSRDPHCTETTAEVTTEKASASGTCLPGEVSKQQE